MQQPRHRLGVGQTPTFPGQAAWILGHPRLTLPKTRQVGRHCARKWRQHPRRRGDSGKKCPRGGGRSGRRRHIVGNASASAVRGVWRRSCGAGRRAGGSIGGASTRVRRRSGGRAAPWTVWRWAGGRPVSGERGRPVLSGRQPVGWKAGSGANSMPDKLILRVWRAEGSCMGGVPSGSRACFAPRTRAVLRTRSLCDVVHKFQSWACNGVQLYCSCDSNKIMSEARLVLPHSAG